MRNYYRNQHLQSEYTHEYTQIHMNTHNHLIVTIDYHSQTQEPELTANGDFYKIYSPKKFKLRPRDDI